MEYLNHLDTVVKNDASALKIAAKNYGGSFKKRGGTGHFMMLARKWDRLELACDKGKYDIYQVIRDDKRPEGIIDDIRDLRRYLVLVEAEMMAQGVIIPDQKKNVTLEDDEKPTEVHAGGVVPYRPGPAAG